MEKRLRKNAEIIKDNMKIPNHTLKFQKITFKKMWYSVAGVLLMAVLVLNCVPQISYASQDIPVVGDIIKVVTFGRFLKKADVYEAVIDTPQIYGLLNKELEERLNNDFKENSKLVIFAFEKDIAELSKEFGEDFHLGVETSYVVRTDNDNILAIDTYIVDTVASSSTRHSFYNIDKKEGTLLELKDLFKVDADYVTPISNYISEEMKKQNENGTGNFWIGDYSFEGFEKIKENQNFFINDSGNIVVCFDKYEVAIGAQGCPEFEIPAEIVKDILR